MERMESWLTQNPWMGMLLWTFIYISDYVMTIASARKYGTNPHISIEGSYELTPQFEKDVDALSPVSKRHILMLILTNLLLITFWLLLSLLGYTQGFAFVLGMLILLEVGVHLRHFRTYHLLALHEAKGGLEGTLHYRRWLLFNVSAFEFFCLCILFLITALLTYSPFFAGGSLACLSLAANHYKKYRKLYDQTTPEETKIQ
jgi:amino acid permease